MAERIEYPPEPQGTAEEQLQQVFRYLRRISEQLNDNQEVTDKNLTEYISAQASALRNITGTALGKTTDPNTDIRELTAELVNTLQTLLEQIRAAAGDTVTASSFTNLWIEKARATPVTPVGSSTAFIVASAIRALQDTAADYGAQIGKLEDQTGEMISGSRSGFVYSGVIGTDAGDNPIYGTAIGEGVVTWSGNTATYHPENAWAIFRASGSTIGGNGIPTPAEVAAKAARWAGSTTETNIDHLTAPGKYVITVNTETMSGLPDGITNGAGVLLEVEADGEGVAMQRIYDTGRIYTRIAGNNTWGEWYLLEGENEYANIDVIDNLSSSATNKALSANQGRVLETTSFRSRNLSNPIDMNNTALIGSYFAQASECDNLPTSGAGAFYDIQCFGTYQMVHHINPNGLLASYHRNYINNRWYPWTMYSHPGMQNFSINKQTSKTITISNNAKVRIDAFGAAADLCGTILINANASGTISMTQIGCAHLTVTADSANTLTIENTNTNYGCSLYCTVYHNTVTVA